MGIVYVGVVQMALEMNETNTSEMIGDVVTASPICHSALLTRS